MYIGSKNTWVSYAGFGMSNDSLAISISSTSNTYSSLEIGGTYDIMTFTSPNKTLIFRPEMVKAVGANSSINVALDKDSTFLISCSGNSWLGVYIVQVPHSGNARISELISPIGWKIEVNNLNTISISNLDGYYSCTANITRI